jgi:ParB-like chromosome segregation protein Spo0J
MKRKAKHLFQRSALKQRSNPFSHTALEVETLPIRDVQPNPNNSRRHPAKQIEKIRRAIDEFGFLIPVLIDERNTIIAGHARIEAAEQCGLTAVPCVRTSHLTEAQKRAFAIVDNRLAQDAVWDFRLLAKEFRILTHRGR